MTAPNAGVDSDLASLAQALEPRLRNRLLELVAADSRAVKHAEVIFDLQRSEDLVAEFRRQMPMLQRRVDELAPAVDRVRRLHSQNEASILAPGKWCPACGQETPCPTIRALKGDR